MDKRKELLEIINHTEGFKMLTYSHQNIDQSDIDALTKALKDEILTGVKR